MHNCQLEKNIEHGIRFEFFDQRNLNFVVNFIIHVDRTLFSEDCPLLVSFFDFCIEYY